MSILDIQKRTRRLGEIRIGDKGDKGQPVKLTTFRLTSSSSGLLKQASELWGGTVTEWDNRFSLTTQTSTLPVVVPPQDPNSISWYELWSSGGLQRRCDGEQMILGDAPTKCICDPDNRACKPTTRVQFMLPDIQDIGVWVLRSTGYYAAAELGAAMDLLLRQMDDTGWMPLATLAIEERTVKRPGQPTNRFVVPTLRLHTKLSDLLPAGDPAPALEAPLESDTAAVVEGEDAGSRPLPVPPPPTAPVDDRIMVAKVEPDRQVLVEIDGRDLLSELLDETPNDGNMKVIQDRLRRLFNLMEANGFEHWGDRGLHAALASKYNAEHLADLRRESLEVFATSAFMAAKGLVDGED